MSRRNCSRIATTIKVFPNDCSHEIICAENLIHYFSTVVYFVIIKSNEYRAIIG